MRRRREEACLGKVQGVENEGANPGRIGCTFLFWSTAARGAGGDCQGTFFPPRGIKAC
jgi:hypothetical protein